LKAGRRLVPPFFPLVAVLALATGTALAAPRDPSIIPNPASMTRQPGEFPVTGRTAIVVAPGDASAYDVAASLKDLIRRSHRMALPIERGAAREGAINLRLEPVPAKDREEPEAYRVEVRTGRATIAASSPAGLHHGATTLWQLLTPAAAIPNVTIDDAPRFAWRGIMLDSARHYQSPRFIERFIDAMAVQKLNVLHWHLTDDQAWRLQIRKYPALTAVGAWRVPAGAASAADIDPATGKPRLYGGFYSQETVRSIVGYAAVRGVTIVPEIEMPGHAAAAIAAYPALAAVPSPPTAVPSDWGVYPHVFNIDESTFAFLEDVLREVMELFPGRYIHVGGDEVEKTQWRESAAVRSRMRELGIDDPAKVQPYFTQRIARFLESRGRRLVGWDEILEPGLADNAVVMSWRGIEGAVNAAAKGHDTVLAAHPTLYFDNRQDGAATEPPGRGRIVTLEEVYRFEPMPPSLSPEQQRHVLGLQANVWTEHIRTEERVGWMTFPRAAAVAELGWSLPGQRDWNDFQRRLAAMSARYKALGMTFAKAPPATAAPRLTRKSQELRLCTENIALSLEDDAPLKGPRAAFLVDIRNPCWIFPDAPLDKVTGLLARVGQVPFNFQIGEDVHKIRFTRPTTAEGELEVRLDTCEGELLARLPLATATRSQAVTALPRAAVRPRPGKHDLCLRFAQPGLDPLWVIDSMQLLERAP
jgi:hexosaminidase